MRFSTLGVQMAVLIYLGSELGKYLDEKYTSEKGVTQVGLAHRVRKVSQDYRHLYHR